MFNAPVSIKDYVFQYCYKIEEIDFGRADKIGNYAFFSCTGITNLTVGDNVGSIGDYAFRNCTGITEIHIPEKVNSEGCGEGVFYGCTGLTGTTTFPEHFTFVPAAYYSHCTGLQTLSINESITEIRDLAFCNCTKLGPNFVLPETVASIGDGAFHGCTGFTRGLSLHGNLTLGVGAFSQCSGFTSLTLSEGLTEIPYGAFYNCISMSGSLILPKTVTKVYPYAFYNCSKFTGALDLYNVLDVIGEYAFYRCSGLDGVLTLSPGLIGISNYSFYQCTKLKGGLNMSIFVDFVSSYAFYGCANLNGPLTFSSNLFEIGDYAFYGCSSLNGALHLGFGLRRVGAYAFYQCSKLTGSLRIGYRKFEKYSEYENGGYYYDYYTCRICDYAFYGCSRFTGDLLLFYVSYIGKFAFYRCGFTGSLTVPISIIDDYAFYGCSGFKGPLSFDDSNLWTGLKYDYTIGKYAFYNCAGFNGTLTIPPEYQVIGDYAFCGCSGFNFYLKFADYYYQRNNKLYSIGKYAFYNCSKFTGELELPTKLSYIGECAFANCSSFKYLTIYDGYYLHIGKNAFESTNFTSLDYTESATNSMPLNYVEPSYEYPIGFNKNITIYVNGAYRSPSFCGYDFFYSGERLSFSQSDSYDFNNLKQIKKQYSNADEYRLDFPSQLQNENQMEKTESFSGGVFRVNFDDDTIESVPFFSDLADDQYFSSSVERINYEKGKLNLLLDKDNNVNTIDISQNSEVPLSINLDSTRNTRELELLSEQPSITLNSKSVLKGDLEIVVPEKVTSFVMNEISLIGDGNLAVKRKISSTTREAVSMKYNLVDIEINNVTIEKSTSAELSHMKIKGPLKIFQGSTVTFSNNVTLEETDITYILETLNTENDGIFDLDSEKTFKSVPKSINFQLPEDQFNISQPSALILIKEKEFDCKPWESIIVLNDDLKKYYEKAECVPTDDDSDNSKLLEEDSDSIREYSLILKEKEYNSPDRDPKVVEKTKKLSGGAIAGIVIGCIVVVVALMIGEFFLVKHILNNKDPSEKEAEEV